jgi:hypothetical protein
MCSSFVCCRNRINEDEELSYVDEDAMMETDKTDPRFLVPESRDSTLAETADLSKGSEAKTTIDLDSDDVGVREQNLSGSSLLH